MTHLWRSVVTTIGWCAVVVVVIIAVRAFVRPYSDGPTMQDEAEEQWNLDYIPLSHKFQDSTLQCTREVYAETYKNPLMDSPACRESCRLGRQINVMADRSPREDRELFRINLAKECYYEQPQ